MIKLLTAITTLIAVSSYAQPKLASVSGMVTDGLGKPAQFATVSLFTANDSGLTKTAITSLNGNFGMAGVKPGKYFLLASSIGYKKSLSSSFELAEGQEFYAPLIILSLGNAKELSEVSFDIKRPMIEVRADKMIFNIESSINATGSNAFEILEKCPGITIDKDDNISMQGKNGVSVYIDGKTSPMGPKDLADFLRSINSADMESVELITNPSAKYDAAGNAGIINIKLKKNKYLGTNGSFTTGLVVGKTAKQNNALSLNYRNKKVNLFSNYSNNFGTYENLFNLYRKQNDSVYDQQNVILSNRQAHNFKAGMDFFIDNKNTIGFIVNANFNNTSQMTNGSTAIMHSRTSMPTKILYATNNLPGKRRNLNYNINYRYANPAGYQLNIDGDLGRFRETGTSYQPNYYRTPITNILLEEKIYKNSTPTDINIETFKVDYEQPYNKGRLGVGGKLSYVNTKNTFDFFNVISGYDIMDSGRSNKFDYTENINAIYINYNKPLGKKWTIQAGVRMENTVSEGNLISFYPNPDNNVKRNYTDLFPSGALTLILNKKSTFNLSYSRRIDRPSYQDLNPFENKIDELTFQKGNAFLRPQYTNILMLSHTFMSKYNTTLTYSHIKDYRAQIIDTVDKNRTFLTQKNLASQDIINLNFSAPFAVTKWWNIFFNFNGYHSSYKADFGQGKKINLNVDAFTVFVQQTFILKESTTIELSGFYNSPHIWGGTFRTKAMGGMDIGIQRTIFKGKGTIKFSQTDIFKTIKLKGISDFGGAYIDLNGQAESHLFKVTFTYHFGNSQVKAARQRKIGSEDENKRIDNSGGL